jgi:hypothetical protein
MKATLRLKMRWFRDHIRHGSWLALVAIAINFAVAFGHVHAPDRADSERSSAALSAASGAPDSDQTPNHPADDLCPICMAAAAMGTAFAPTPPALPVEFAAVAIDRAIEQAFAVAYTPRAAFQSRAPPFS